MLQTHFPLLREGVACHIAPDKNKAALRQRAWPRAQIGESMTRVRIILIACLVSLCGHAWAADTPAIQAGGRVGIIEMVTNDVTHFHVGRSELTNFMRTYRGDWGASDVIDVPLMNALADAGFQPVAVAASETLREEKQSWLIQNPQANKLSRGCLKELARIMADVNLAALIVVAPGANSDPDFVWSRLPKTVQGFGVMTSDEPTGGTKAAVFDFTQIAIVANTADGAALVVRDWGANLPYDWPGFDSRTNLKALTNGQLAQIRLVIEDAMKKRIATRIVPRLKP